MGHQWYWSYELGDFLEQEIEIDQYIIRGEDLDTNGVFRFLDVDNRPLLPYLVQIRIVVGRIDVLHS